MEMTVNIHAEPVKCGDLGMFIAIDVGDMVSIAIYTPLDLAAMMSAEGDEVTPSEVIKVLEGDDATDS